MEAKDLIKPFSPGYRYSPPVFAILVLGLLLLFFRDLSDPIRRYLVPSIALYAFGSVLIAMAHETISQRGLARARSRDEEFAGIRDSTLIAIIAVHALWLAALVAYNVFRAVL